MRQVRRTPAQRNARSEQHALARPSSPLADLTRGKDQVSLPTPTNETNREAQRDLATSRFTIQSLVHQTEASSPLATFTHHHTLSPPTSNLLASIPAPAFVLFASNFRNYLPGRGCIAQHRPVPPLATSPPTPVPSQRAATAVVSR